VFRRPFWQTGYRASHLLPRNITLLLRSITFISKATLRLRLNGEAIGLCTEHRRDQLVVGLLRLGEPRREYTRVSPIRAAATHIADNRILRL
jgi:hypothetical protein